MPYLFYAKMHVNMGLKYIIYLLNIHELATFSAFASCSLEKYGHILPGDILYHINLKQYFLCIVWKLLVLLCVTALRTPSVLSDSPQVHLYIVRTVGVSPLAYFVNK